MRRHWGKKNDKLRKKRPEFKFNSQFYKATLSFSRAKIVLEFPISAQNEIQNEVNTVILLLLINCTLALMGDRGVGKSKTGNYKMPSRQPLV